MERKDWNFIMYSLLDLVGGSINEFKREIYLSIDLVQNLFPSNFFGNCDIEEERKLSII